MTTYPAYSRKTRLSVGRWPFFWRIRRACKQLWRDRESRFQICPAMSHSQTTWYGLSLRPSLQLGSGLLATRYCPFWEQC